MTVLLLIYQAGLKAVKVVLIDDATIPPVSSFKRRFCFSSPFQTLMEDFCPVSLHRSSSPSSQMPSNLLERLPSFDIFFITIKIELKTQVYRIQLTVPPKAGQDTGSSSPHFKWHLQFFSQGALKVQASLVPNNAKQALILL